MTENREHCKAIAERLEAVANGDFYRCPECGEWITFSNNQYNGESAEYTCQECGATFDGCDLEAVSFWDYFEGSIYDIEYRLNAEREYKSVRIMVACGGPNIYIDTAAQAVELYWWTDRDEYPIDPNTCNVIDEYFEELFNC